MQNVIDITARLNVKRVLARAIQRREEGIDDLIAQLPPVNRSEMTIIELLQHDHGAMPEAVSFWTELHRGR